MKETTDKEIQRVAVIGTGLMGHGIAQAFAVKGYDVNLLSRSMASLESAVQKIEWSLGKFVNKGVISNDEAEAALSRIATTTAYQDAIGDIDLALESVSESIELKKRVVIKTNASCFIFLSPKVCFNVNVVGLILKYCI